MDFKGHFETGARLRLAPHRHGTDGFFAAILERR
jgi:16S rRNA C967 or C1407 C5-methylase (RsmB/RsmF family)